MSSQDAAAAAIVVQTAQLTVVEKRIGYGADDAEESQTGVMSLASTDLELVFDGNNQLVGMRFVGLPIPKGAVISNAYVQFGVDEVSLDATTLTLRGEAADNAAVLAATGNNLSSRLKTTAAVTWTPATWPTVGEIGINQRTPNLATIVQEVVNRTGWASGNALLILVSGTGRRTAYAYEVMPTAAPLLHVEFTTGSIPSPTTFERRIALNNDDGEESSVGGVSLTSSDLELVYDGNNQTVGMRFTEVTIPKGALVSNAYIQFGVDEVSTDVATLTLRGEAADTAAALTTASYNLSSRVKTGASVAWAPPSWPTVGEMGVNQRTPNLTTIVQEIVNRSGWSSGNALVMLVTGTGRRTAYAYEVKPTAAPLLHVEYSTSGVNQAPLANAGPDQSITLPTSTNLAGSATDDGLPSNQLSYTWSKVSGPGVVTFGNTAAANTTASFSLAGSYLLRLTVSDGALTGLDEVNITVNPASNMAVTFVGAGDIADCNTTTDELTAQLLDNIPGTVFTVGDNAYIDGTDSEFANCYGPTWGRHKSRTKPAAGNHEYHTTGATGYFNYFGAAAGTPGKGYYSYNLGAWHIVVLNSECANVGGCDRYSQQGQWLQADLQANPSRCTLAYWHRPRFSSGMHGSDNTMGDFWELLYAAGADVVINAHDHLYERFAPQNPQAQLDSARGLREFIVGTGGTTLNTNYTALPNSRAYNTQTHGVLKLTLNATSYDWVFVPVAGKSFTDTGSTVCSNVSASVAVATELEEEATETTLLSDQILLPVILR